MAAFDQPGLEQQRTQDRLVWSNKANFRGFGVLASAIQALNLASKLDLRSAINLCSAEMSLMSILIAVSSFGAVLNAHNAVEFFPNVGL